MNLSAAMLGLSFLSLVFGAIIVLNPSVIHNFDVSDIFSAVVIIILLAVIVAASARKSDNKKHSRSKSSADGDYITVSQIFSSSGNTETFESSMQHDLRTPLTSLQGAVEILKSSELNENQRACIEIMENATGELRSIIGKLLSLQLDKNSGDNLALSMDEREKFVIASMSKEVTAMHDANFSIILAEDSKVNLKVMEVMLKQIGCKNLRQASNGEEVIRMFKEKPADLIIMDCRMPIMDGYETSINIRKTAGGDKAKIFALTASVSEAEKKKALAAGMDDFYAKPLSKATLTYMISQAASRPRPAVVHP